MRRMLLHANGHFMQVTREPLRNRRRHASRARHGHITAIRRLDP